MINLFYSEEFIDYNTTMEEEDKSFFSFLFELNNKKRDQERKTILKEIYVKLQKKFKLLKEKHDSTMVSFNC